MAFRKKKVVLFNFLPYEYKCLEEYLEKMAEKGWILEEISNSYLKFVRSESRSVKYLVYIINKVSSLGNKDNTKESDYKNYYKEAGWTFVCESDKIQIYSSEFYNMKIDTNENEIEKFNTISKASFKYVFSKLILATFLLLPQYLGTIGQKNMYFLADPLKLGSFTVVFILFISELLNLITFLLFFIKGKLAIKDENKVQYKVQHSFAFKKLINKITSCSMIIIFLSFGINFYYNYYNRNINEVALNLEDFNDVNKNDYEYFRVNKSPIAKYIFYSNEGNKMYLSYDLFESKYKWPVKYNFNKEINSSKEFGVSYIEKETSLPKDIKVYVNEERFKYIIISENKMIEIYEADSISEDELINTVYKKVFK